MKYYILYGKAKDMKRFMPLDLSEGVFVKKHYVCLIVQR